MRIKLWQDCHWEIEEELSNLSIGQFRQGAMIGWDDVLNLCCVEEMETKIWSLNNWYERFWRSLNMQVEKRLFVMLFGIELMNWKASFIQYWPSLHRGPNIVEHCYLYHNREQIYQGCHCNQAGCMQNEHSMLRTSLVVSNFVIHKFPQSTRSGNGSTHTSKVLSGPFWSMSWYYLLNPVPRFSLLIVRHATFSIHECKTALVTPAQEKSCHQPPSCWWTSWLGSGCTLLKLCDSRIQSELDYGCMIYGLFKTKPSE